MLSSVIHAYGSTHVMLPKTNEIFSYAHIFCYYLFDFDSESMVLIATILGGMLVFSPFSTLQPFIDFHFRIWKTCAWTESGKRQISNG